KERKTILFVSTKPPLREMVENFAKELGFPYIVNRWLGGTFTNFSEIKARVETLKELERQRESGELEKYTKKERMLIERKIKKLNEKFGGLKTLENLPDAVFIVDLVRDNLAAKEAKRRKIPVIAICDTNANPELADYFFPANDDALPAVSFILSKVKEAILRGRGQQ
ncbi:30S ribosomal protein S2, partial [Candidatus Parcubacteria bacterium]|nr:30S ribosomal protein S2 [Candidatus Parcubacteria bacterium]